jgi:hypothetical protein
MTSKRSKSLRILVSEQSLLLRMDQAWETCLLIDLVGELVICQKYEPVLTDDFQ